MFWKRYGKTFVVPVAAVLGVSAGAVGGAFAFDQVASRYLWPAPENLIVSHATPASHTVTQARETPLGQAKTDALGLSVVDVPAQH